MLYHAEYKWDAVQSSENACYVQHLHSLLQKMQLQLENYIPFKSYSYAQIENDRKCLKFWVVRKMCFTK